MPILPQRMRDIRILHKDTLDGLAEKLCITKQSVSKYETGKMIPAGDVLKRMMDIYGISADFLQMEIRQDVVLSSLYHRKIGRISEKEIEYRRTLTRYAYEILEICNRFTHISTLQFPDFAENASIEEKAVCLREFWHLGTEPIYNLEAVLSSFGIHTFMYDFESEGMDGCARQIGDKGIIILNRARGTAARRTFDLAHELGHFALNTESEEAANAFAGAFLLPESRMRKEILRTDLDYLCEIKTRWGVSVSCLLERCRCLELLKSDPEYNFARYNYLRKQIRNRGWDKTEPGEQIEKRENTLEITKIITQIWDHAEQNEQFLDAMYIPLDLVRNLCSLPETMFGSYVNRRHESEVDEFDGVQLSFNFAG